MADVADFETLSARDAARALHQLARFRDALESAVSAGGGTVHSDAATGALAEFASAEAALDAAVQLVDSFSTQGDGRARVGVHLGEIVATEQGEILGDGVTVAQRLLEAADPNEVLVSSDFQRQLRAHSGFYFRPLGEKLLRGVVEPVDTFAVRRRRDDDTDEIPLLTRIGVRLRSRRTRVTLSVLGVYFAVIWTAVQIAAFIEERYQLTPNITEVTLASLLLLLPSILLVTYYHADPGKQRMPLPEKVGIPANLIAASVIIVLMFGAEDIGAVMQQVEVTNEAGETVTRAVPKAEYRKRLAFFPFQVEGGDADQWLDYGFVYAVTGKLAQDPFFDAQSPAHFRARLMQTAFEDGRDVPVALQREIAEERHLTHFVTGTIARDAAGGVTATVRLYDSARGRRLTEHRLTAPDVFTLSDLASEQIKTDLDIPAWHREQLADLPTAEVMTGSVRAFQAYVEGINAVGLDNDYDTAQSKLESAVTIDPTFAMAHMSLATVQLLANKMPAAAASFAATMEHLYRIPERLQILARHNYYYTHGDVGRAFAVVDMGVDLYPDDIMLLSTKAQLDFVRNRREETIGSMQRILELDPEQHQLLHVIATLNEALGRVDEAHANYTEYTDRFPENYDGFLKLADFLGRVGRHEEAAKALQRAALLDSGNVQITVRLAAAERDLGRFDETERLLADALELARSANDRAIVLHSMHQYSAFRGRMVRALEERESEIAETAKFQPPLNVLLQRLRATASYVHAGQPETGQQIIDSLSVQLQSPYDALAAIGQLSIANARDDADAIEAAIPGLERMIDALSMEIARSMAVFAKGRVHELRGEYEQAIASYLEERKLSPTDTSVNHQIARCLHALGRHEEARRELAGALQVSPKNPDYHYTMALILRDTGRTDEARKHIETALEVWADADLHWLPAQRAREVVAAL